MKLNNKSIEKYLPYVFILTGLIISLSTLTVHSLWFDEHLTMNEAQSRTLKDMMTLVMRHESIPPLFFVLEYFMVKIFSLSAFTLRIIPALAGTLGTFFCWRIFLKVTDRVTALMALILCLASSLLLIYSQEARPYSIFFCESMALLFFSIRWFDKRDFKNAAGVAVSMIVAMNTHYYALFMNAAVIFSMIIADRDRSRYLKGYIAFVIAALFSVISVLPWLIEQIALQVSGQKSSLIAKAVVAIPFIPVSTLTGTALTKITGREDFGGWNAVVLLLLVPVFCITAIAIFRFLRQGNILTRMKVIPLFLILFFMTAFAEHIVTGFRIPSLHPRYTIYFMMLLSGGIVCFTASTKILRNIVFVILLLINIFGLVENYWGNTVAYRIPWSRIASDIDSELPKVSVVASSDNMHVFVLPYYMKSDAKIALFDKQVFWTSDALVFLREPYPFFNRKVQIYQQKFEYYSSEQNKPDIADQTFADFLKLNPLGIYIYQEDGMPYNEDFLKHSIPELKVKIIHHYETNQGIVYIVKWEYVV